MDPVYFFRVNLFDRNSFLIQPPDSNPANILFQLKSTTIWVEGYPHPLKHGDAFTLSGGDAVRAKKFYIDNKQQRPFTLEMFDIPDVSNINIEALDGIATITWNSNSSFLTYIETATVATYWEFAREADKGENTMSIEVEPGNFYVRLRFTDGYGNYSRHYATGNIEVDPTEEVCNDTNIELPLNENTDTNDLIGCLHGSAEYYADEENSSLTLTQDVADQYGILGYNSTEIVGLDSFSIQFEFKYVRDVLDEESPGVVTYIYFFADQRPMDEYGKPEGTLPDDEEYERVNCYIVSFRELNQEVVIEYAGNSIASIEYEFDEDAWYSVRVIFTHGNFAIYINDGLAMTAGDNDYEDRIIDEDHVKIGIGARTNDNSAVHYLRQIVIEEEEYEAPPSIIDDVFGLSFNDDENPNSIFQLNFSEEEEDSLIKETSSNNHTKYQRMGMAYNTDNDLTYILARVAYNYDTEEEVTQLSFFSVDLNDNAEEEITEIELTLNGYEINDILSLGYYNNGFIACVVDASSTLVFLRIGLDGQVSMLNDSLNVEISGMIHHSGTLYCVGPMNTNEAYVFLYDPDTGFPLLDEESQPIRYLVELEDGITPAVNANIMGLAIRTIESTPHLVTCMDLIMPTEGDEEEETFQTNAIVTMTLLGVVTAMTVVDYRLYSMCYVAEHGQFAGVTNNISNNIVKPETIYWIANSSGVVTSPVGLERLQLTYDETDESARLCWNKNDGYFYQLICRDYGNN